MRRVYRNQVLSDCLYHPSEPGPSIRALSFSVSVSVIPELGSQLPTPCGPSTAPLDGSLDPASFEVTTRRSRGHADGRANLGTAPKQDIIVIIKIGVAHRLAPV